MKVIKKKIISLKNTMQKSPKSKNDLKLKNTNSSLKIEVGQSYKGDEKQKEYIRKPESILKIY
jgi:hypothetical protein